MDLDVTDVAPRIKEHRERQGRLEVAAEEERLRLSERRAVLDNVETITGYARDMRHFPSESELTEARPFIRSPVKEIVVEPGKAAIRYTIPMPKDSPIGDSDTEELPLRSPLLSLVTYGGLDMTSGAPFARIVRLLPPAHSDRRRNGFYVPLTAPQATRSPAFDSSSPQESGFSYTMMAEPSASNTE